MCPRCLHIFHKKIDITRHHDRINKCASAFSHVQPTAFVKKKLYNRYYFHGVESFPKLSKYQRMNMVMRYDDDVNLIYDTSLLLSELPPSVVEDHQKAILNFQEPMVDDLPPFTEPSTEPSTESSMEPSKKEDIVKRPQDMLNDRIVMVDGVKKFQCEYCKYNFSCKRNLFDHYESPKACNLRVKTNKIIQQSTIIKETESISKYIESIESLKKSGGYNRVHLLDFANDNYDYSHIDKKLALDPSFFYHKRFLSTLFSNNANKNVFFDKKYGYFYVNNKIERARKDKVGYILMEKLATTIESFIRTNPLITLDDHYTKIIHFYSVERLKYCMDTVYRSYDMINHVYIYSKNMYLRTRDVHLSNIISMVNHYKDLTLMMMGIESIDDIIPGEEYKLDIPENYHAIQLRYSVPRKKNVTTTMIPYK